MSAISSICVFCGSSAGVRPEYAQGARSLGIALAEKGIRLVYGGGSVGLMGILADAVLTHGGKVAGVIPQALWDREVGHKGLTELFVVPDMHTRKAKMAALSDAFVAMPGGYGTLEELFEVLTWAQLGFHQKPIGILDLEGYYAGLRSFIDSAVHEGFVRAAERQFVVFGEEPRRLLEDVLVHVQPPAPRWIREGET